MKHFAMFCSAVLAVASCRDRPGEVISEPSSTEAAREIKGAARSAGDKLKGAVDEVAAGAKDVAGKAGEEIKEGARDFNERALQPMWDRMGDGLKNAADRMEQAAAEGRAEAMRDMRAKVDDVERWFAEDAKPAAKNTGRKLWDEIRELARDLGQKLDRVEGEAGPAAERTRRDIKDGVEKLRAKLRRAGEEARSP